jgi:hypothetical protein
MTRRFLLGAYISGPYVGAQALWLLTGRGPFRWIFRPTKVAFVNPVCDGITRRQQSNGFRSPGAVDRAG